MTLSHLLVALLVVVLAGVGAAAQQEPPPSSPTPVRPTVKRVTLFKNGLAYVEMAVPARAGSGWVHVIPPSLPLHGSFWVSHDPARLRVLEAVAERVKVEEETRADSIQGLLAANLGREVLVRAGEQDYRGTLISYPGTGAAAGGGARAVWPGDADPEPAPGSLVLIKTSRGIVGLNPGAIQQVLFEGADAVETLMRTRHENRLRVRIEQAAEGAEFLLQYLTQGLAWAPSYRLDLGDGGKARFEARADVINDSMDLAGVEASLASGFPNLRFTHVPGALGLRTSLDEFARLLAMDPAQQGRREQMMTQSVYSNVAFQSEAGLAPTSSQGFEGEAREDMFFSRLGTISLTKGGRGNWPLFSVEVPCEQVFRWEIADYLNTQGYYRPQQEAQGAEEVWHSLRLTNETTAPWTTAPLTVIKGGAVVGQDICYYTSAGGRTLVKVTKALNIRAEQQEHELERKREAERLYGHEYDLVTIQGTLYLCSYKSGDVTVEISKTLSGDLQKADESPTVNKLGRGLLQVNPMNRINWRLTLPAGKEVKLTYVYKVLVRR